MSVSLAGAGIGGLGGLGLVTAIRFSPPLRRPRLDDRLAPYLGETAPASRLLLEQKSLTPFPILDELLGPAVAAVARSFERLVGGGESVRRRLDALGRGQTVAEFRAEQVLCGAAGLGVGLVAVAVAAARGRGQPVALLIFCVLCVLAGVLGRDHRLSAAVRRRDQRMLSEFPTVAELLALAVAAGETPVSALDRVCQLTRGELSRELARALAEARAGTPFVAAIDGIARRTSLPSLARFADGIAIALERGTPLADVLRAQAMDVREAGKRALLESGGRREIGMLVPVVFGILPVVVLFALFPGFYTLSLSAP